MPALRARLDSAAGGCSGEVSALSVAELESQGSEAEGALIRGEKP